MPNILRKFTKAGVITTGDDGLELDSPRFEIVGVHIDTLEQMLKLEVMHYADQGAVEQKHSRVMNVQFSKLPASVRTTGKAFLDALEAELLKLPQYAGATPV